MISASGGPNYRPSRAIGCTHSSQQGVINFTWPTESHLIGNEPVYATIGLLCCYRDDDDHDDYADDDDDDDGRSSC